MQRYNKIRLKHKKFCKKIDLDRYSIAITSYIAITENLTTAFNRFFNLQFCFMAYIIIGVSHFLLTYINKSCSTIIIFASPTQVTQSPTIIFLSPTQDMQSPICVFTYSSRNTNYQMVFWFLGLK